jgi:hypothetical protein
MNERLLKLAAMVIMWIPKEDDFFYQNDFDGDRFIKTFACVGSKPGSTGYSYVYVKNMNIV